MQAAVLTMSWVRFAVLAAVLAAAGGVALAAAGRAARADAGVDGGGGGHGGRDGCPDQGTKKVESKIRYGPTQKCGSGLTVQGGPLTIHNPRTDCPTFAIYEPPYDDRIHKEGFQTHPAGQVPITMGTFRCVNRWFLGWIPIPIGSDCVLDKTKSVGAILNYKERSCDPRHREGYGVGRGTLPGGGD